MRRWFGAACTQSGLGWTPATFWTATIVEYLMACDGHSRIMRGGREPVTSNELKALIARYPDSKSIKRSP